MRPQKVNDQELIIGLMEVLRTKGYDGASLNDLAAATGLQKASLYHRFPGGKKQITQAVLDFVIEWIDNSIYKVLTNSSSTPMVRIEKVLDNINQLYGNGEKTCLLRALSMDSGIDLFGKQLEASMQLWIAGFQAIGIEIGYSKDKAHQLAKQTLIQIQGSLVVSKALKEIAPFQKALVDIKTMYIQ